MEQKHEYVIRRMKRKDCKEIYQMLFDMAVYEKMEDQVKVTVEQLEEDGFGIQPKYYSFVVECTQTQKLIGYTVYYFIYSTWKAQIGYLEDVYVEESWRQRGIGTELIKMVLADVLSKGCMQCRLACLQWNQVPLKLYKTLGAKNLTKIEDWHMLRFDHEAMIALTK